MIFDYRDTADDKEIRLKNGKQEATEFIAFVKSIEGEWKTFQTLKEGDLIKDMTFRVFLSGGKMRKKLHLNKSDKPAE